MSVTDLREKKNEAAQAQENALKRVKRSEARELSLWRTCIDVSLLLLKKNDSEKVRIVEKEQSSLQSAGPAVHCYCTGKSAEPLTLFLKKDWEAVAARFLGLRFETEGGKLCGGNDYVDC